MVGPRRSSQNSDATIVFTLHSCGSAERRLSRAIRTLPDARVARAGDDWDQATTHVVTPSVTRSLKVVCAMASGARLVRPAFIDHCAELGLIPPDVPPEMEWGSGDSSDPRIRADAAALWRQRRSAGFGGPLQDVPVLIAGQLAPRARGAGVITSRMASQILTAAGARIVSRPADAVFALAADMGGKRPVVAQLRKMGVVCFGPAILVDLIARVVITPSEFLTFMDQASLVSQPIDAPQVISSAIVPLVVAQSVAQVPPSNALTLTNPISSAHISPSAKAASRSQAVSTPVTSSPASAQALLQTSTSPLRTSEKLLVVPLREGAAVSPVAASPFEGRPRRTRRLSARALEAQGSWKEMIQDIHSVRVRPAIGEGPAREKRRRTIDGDNRVQEAQNEIVGDTCSIQLLPPAEDSPTPEKRRRTMDGDNGDGKTQMETLLDIPGMKPEPAAEGSPVPEKHCRTMYKESDDREERKELLSDIPNVQPQSAVEDRPVPGKCETSVDIGREVREAQKEIESDVPGAQPKQTIKGSRTSAEHRRAADEDHENREVQKKITSDIPVVQPQPAIEDSPRAEKRRRNIDGNIVFGQGRKEIECDVLSVQPDPSAEDPPVPEQRQRRIEEDNGALHHFADSPKSASSDEEVEMRKPSRARISAVRRRIQLQTPDTSEAPCSEIPQTRTEAKCESFYSDAQGLTEMPMGCSMELFTSGISFSDAHHTVLGLLGGAVTPDEVERLIPHTVDESPTVVIGTERDEPLERENRKGRANVPLFEDSPQDFSEANIDSQQHVGACYRENLNLISQEPRSVLDRARDDHSSAWYTSVRKNRKDESPLTVPAMTLPKSVTAIPEIIPKRLYSLACWSSLANVADGNADDDDFFRNTVQYQDWVYGAESVVFDSRSRKSLLQSRQSMSGMDVASCLKHMRDANLLLQLTSVVELRPEKSRILLAICLRLLSLGLPDNMMSLLLGLLLRARDSELERGNDSLCNLVHNSGKNSNERQGYLQSVWVSFVDACRGNEDHGDLSSFWRLFNDHWLSGAGKDAMGGTAVANDESNMKMQQVLTSLLTLSGLFAFQLDEPVEERTVVLSPNWVLLEKILNRHVEFTYPSVKEHRRALFELLRRICVQFADGLWKVEERFVLKSLDAVKAICTKFDTSCSCSSLPQFLSQFRSINDLRSRRRSLAGYLRTECDCVIFLSWALIAQEPKSSSKLSTKIVRHSTSFLKTKGCSKDPAKALAHHLGLMLSISESICQGESKKEDLLRAMMFSKAPDISKAAKDPFAFGPSAIDCWSSVLETVKVRCRTLLAQGSSIHGYSDYICSNVASCLQCIEKPEARFAGDVQRREAWRVQQRVFIDLVVKLLSTFAAILELLVQNISHGSYSNHSAVDYLLASLSKFVGRLGKFATGLVLQISSNQAGATSSGRQAVITSIFLFIEQCLDLCTIHSHGKMRRQGQIAMASSQSTFPPASQTSNVGSGVDGFVKNVKTSMFTAFMTMLRRKVSTKESKADLELRVAASRALAKTLGLCCISPRPDYTAECSGELLKVVQDSNMSVFDLGTIYRSPAPMFSQSQPSYSQIQAYSQPSFPMTQSHMSVQESELLVQTEFWSALLDSTWSQSVFQISERLEEIAFGMWVVILVTTCAGGVEPALHKALSALSYGIQSAASSRPNIGRWFYATKFGRVCKEASAHPTSAPKVTELDEQGRLEALVDCFCAILQSWTSAKVLNLVNFIRGFVTMERGVTPRSGMEAKPGSFFCPSKDLEEGEQYLLHAQVLSVLFVVHGSLSLPSSQYRGGRVGNGKAVSKQFLHDISESLLRAVNKFRKGRSPKHEIAHYQIQTLVITGLATVGYDPRDLETRISFLRLARLCGCAERISGLFTWNDETRAADFLKREPFMLKPSTAAGNNAMRYRAAEKSGREWRLLAFHTLVEDPIRRLPVTRQEFRNALRYMLDLLQAEQYSNIRQTGLWPGMFACIKQIGIRRQSPDFSSGGQSVSSLLDKMWAAARFQLPDYELVFVKTSLLGGEA